MAYTLFYTSFIVLMLRVTIIPLKNVTVKQSVEALFLNVVLFNFNLLRSNIIELFVWFAEKALKHKAVRHVSGPK